MCANDYGQVAKELQEFIAKAPKLVYKFTYSSEKITKITVTDAQGVSRELATTDYSVSGGNITFKSGVLLIGDVVNFSVIP